jgi:RNA-directed DNA polymerase
VATILNQIYEEDFLGFSCSFRPSRSQHQALDALSYVLLKKKVNHILDADIRGFFDNRQRLAGPVRGASRRRPRILRLIQKWHNLVSGRSELKSRVAEEASYGVI